MNFRNKKLKDKKIRKKMQARRGSRRGVLLLVALSMLVLFLMLGTAFIITARQSRQAAKIQNAAQRKNSALAAQGELLDDVLLQLVRDTNNPNSSLKNHSLLRDMYGEEGFSAVLPPYDANNGSYLDLQGNALNPPLIDSGDKLVARWAPSRKLNGVIQTQNVTGGQILELDVPFVKDLYGNPAVPALTALKQTPDAYNGLTLTFTSGPAEGRSTRIIGYLPAAPADPNYPRQFARFRVMSFAQTDGSLLPAQSSALSQLLAGSSILVNGRPFNGTGVGYWAGARPNSPKLIAQDNTGLLALQPNVRFFFPSLVSTANYFPLGSQDFAGYGGSDESYDAVDFQNMALALMPQVQREVSGNIVAPGADGGSLSNVPIPSLHRPALLNYWAKQGNVSLNPMLLRKTLLRPNWFDHPKFTGGTAELAASVTTFQGILQANNYNLSQIQGNTAAKNAAQQLMSHSIYGPWDVDNDNDGVRDSVWIDFGASIMSMPDGTLVKPLTAVLCVDLDGRLNVNAAGSDDLPGNLTPNTPNLTLAGGTMTNAAPRGQGYGPADVSLAPAVGNNPFKQLLTGGSFGGRFLPGRYGYEARPAKPGRPLVFDIQAQLGLTGLPSKYAAGSLRTEYGTPPDFKARYGLGLNQFGQPVYEAIADTNPNEMLNVDTPYEMNITATAATGELPSAADSPFMLSELERIVRAYDVDAGTLPDRLYKLGNFATTIPNTAINPRNLVTTDSFDLPVPSSVLPTWVSEVGIDGQAGSGDEFLKVMGRPPVNASFADLLEYRFRASIPALKYNSSTRVLPLLNPVQRRQLAALLPRDLANGLRLNVNRPLGNGRDDTQNGGPNGVVDEPGEIEGAYWQLARTNPSAAQGVIDMQPINPNNPNDPAARFSNPSSAAWSDVRDLNGDGVINPQSNGSPNDEIRALNARDVNYRVKWDNRRRQEMARDLYVSALALAEPFDLSRKPLQPASAAKCRQLAQWAINAVDFRDPDSIMTGFEYDANPFDGWDVDGDLSTTQDSLGTNLKTANDDPGGIVWGVERPELLITETMAWHDVAIEDGAKEDPNQGEQKNSTTAKKNPDADYDQLRRPRGAFFMELSNPWQATAGATADTHLLANGNSGADQGVNLAAVYVDPNDATKISPVWRVKIFQDQNVTIETDPDNPEVRLRPQNPDRTIYFTKQDPSGVDPDDGVEFWNGNAPNVQPVQPGGYTVVGSGDPVTAAAPTLADFNNGPYRSSLGVKTDGSTGGRYMQLNPTAANNKVQFVDPDNAMPVLPGNVNNLINAAIVFNWPKAGATSQLPRHLSISEPAKGYPSKYRNAQYDPGLDLGPNRPKGGYAQGGTMTPLAIDTPLDANQNANPNADPRLQPFVMGPNPTSGIIPAFRWVYLQRLANPLLPWNPLPGESGYQAGKAINPYLTIDQAAVNLTVFNGQFTRSAGQPNRNNAKAMQSFASLERGRHNDPQNPTIDNSQQQRADLWNVEHPPTSAKRARQDGKPGNRTHIFDATPALTFGFLNKSYDMDGDYQPDKPFPWLTWNNRPYISENELLQVPTVRSSQLLRAFSMPELKGSNDAYSKTVNVRQLDQQQSAAPLVVDGAFGHLPNFFRTEEDKNGKGGYSIAGLYNLLDYLHVPSRFAGTQTYLNPMNFSTAPTTIDDPRYDLRPPFNNISNYREPGQVNLNTMFGYGVYQGLMHGQTSPSVGGKIHPGPAWNSAPTNGCSLIDSRRGYGNESSGMLMLNSQSPTFFANPFRSSGASDLVPLANMIRGGVQSTMLRSSDFTTVGTAPLDNGKPPLFAAQTNAPYNDSGRNSYFRYQPMTRLANLTTTRSNVYAVWVTVGFFEVTPAPTISEFKSLNDSKNAMSSAQIQQLYNRVYPEGYQLGREYGGDTGDSRRLRGFSIVDRSIPVGFEPGSDHNVSDAIRLKRQIE